MLAALHVAPNRLEVIEVPAPDPAPGEVVVAVRACAFCGSDRHDLAHQPAEPRIAGHEFAGVVVQEAADTPDLVGQAVIVDPIMRCGRCDYCRAGQDHLCRSMAVIGCQTPGGFAELVKAPAGNLHPKPEGLPFAVATLADPLAVALHAAELACAVPGARCLILGAGTIGLLLAQVLAFQEAGEVWLADIEATHLELARRLGAFRTVDLSGGATEGLPGECDLAVEVAGGAAPTLGWAIAAVRKGGTVLCVAQRPPTEIAYPTLLFRELRLQGVFGQRARDFGRAVELLGTGRIAGAPLITDCFPLAEAQAALERFLEPSSVKVVVGGEEQ